MSDIVGIKWVLMIISDNGHEPSTEETTADDPQRITRPLQLQPLLAGKSPGQQCQVRSQLP